MQDAVGKQRQLMRRLLQNRLQQRLNMIDTLKELTADEISMLVDLPEDVDSVMYAGSGSTAEEVGVFTAKDSNQAKEPWKMSRNILMIRRILSRIMCRKRQNGLENAVLEQKNQYVVLCVSGDSDQAKEIIEKAFK